VLGAVAVPVLGEPPVGRVHVRDEVIPLATPFPEPAVGALHVARCVQRGVQPRRYADRLRRCRQDTAAVAKLTTNMSRQQWRDWVSPDIDYIEACPGLPIAPDAPAH